MKRNLPRDDPLEAERRRHLQDIEDIERKLRAWKFVPDLASANVPASVKTKLDVEGLLQEQSATIVYAEIDSLLRAIITKETDMQRQLAIAENDVLVLDTEARNKIVHGMDSEDIRYSVFRKLIAKEKAEIFAEAAGGYQAILESLKDMQRLGFGSAKQEYLPVSKIISSEFYQCKVKAKLYYDSCFSKLLRLNKRLATPSLYDEATIVECQLLESSLP